MTGVQLRTETDGRFLCVHVINHGPSATFSAVVQPGRGTASAAVARPALWHDGDRSDRWIDSGQTAVLRLAQRDRPPAPTEDDDRTHEHPEGSQSWRMCFLKKGIGPALERIFPVVRRGGSADDDGVVLTVMCDAATRTVVKAVTLEGDEAVDADTGDRFRVLDSPRHYHARPASDAR